MGAAHGDLSVGDLDGFIHRALGNPEGRVLHVHRQGVVAHKIPVQGKPVVLENNGGMIGLDKTLPMVVALEIRGHQHAAGTTGVIGDQLIRRQIGQCLIQNPAILFPAEIK